MANEINTVCQANDIDIVASTEANTNGNNNTEYPKLSFNFRFMVLVVLQPALQLQIVASDAAGQSFQDATAMPLSAAAINRYYFGIKKSMMEVILC